MGNVVIPGHTEKAMRKAGKRDGRLWRWTIKPFFITPKTPIPEDSEQVTPRISQTARAAGEVVAKAVETWVRVDGECQKTAHEAVVLLQNYLEEERAGTANYDALQTRACAQYQKAMVNRTTAWKVARTRVQQTNEAYAALSLAYAHANQAARRDSKFEIRVPDIATPAELDGSLKPMHQVLGLSEGSLVSLGLQAEDVGVY